MGDGAITTGVRPRPLQALAYGTAATVAGALILGATQGKTGEQALDLGYWTLAVGILVGAAVGRYGGARSAALVAVPLAVGGAILTQVVGGAVYEGAPDPAAAFDFWRTQILSNNDLSFYAVAAAEGYLVALRVSELRS